MRKKRLLAVAVCTTALAGASASAAFASEVIGPPGSGKGTQAEALRQQYDFVHFDTGSELRREADSVKKRNVVQKYKRAKRSPRPCSPPRRHE